MPLKARAVGKYANGVIQQVQAVYRLLHNQAGPGLIRKDPVKRSHGVGDAVLLPHNADRVQHGDCLIDVFGRFPEEN